MHVVIGANIVTPNDRRNAAKDKGDGPKGVDRGSSERAQIAPWLWVMARRYSRPLSGVKRNRAGVNEPWALAGTFEWPTACAKHLCVESRLAIW